MVQKKLPIANCHALVCQIPSVCCLVWWAFKFANCLSCVRHRCHYQDDLGTLGDGRACYLELHFNPLFIFLPANVVAMTQWHSENAKNHSFRGWVRVCVCVCVCVCACVCVCECVFVLVKEVRQMFLSSLPSTKIFLPFISTGRRVSLGVSSVPGWDPCSARWRKAPSKPFPK